MTERVAVIVGASSGIGLATAELLARRGDRLVFTGLTHERRGSRQDAPGGAD